MTRHIIGLSGGKDSTAMSLRLKELYPDRVFEYVYTPTGDELPEMVKHFEYLESIIGPIKSITGKTLFGLIQERKMIPNFRARWCTVDLKIRPFIAYMESLGWDSVLYVGLRADEEGRLGIIDSTVNVEYPMREWNWTIDDVWDYLEEKQITIPERTDCGSCFFQRLYEWKNLLEQYPDRYEKYVKIEKKIGHTFRSPGRDTWPASLDELRKEFQSGRKLRKSNGKSKSERKCRFCSM